MLYSSLFVFFWGFFPGEGAPSVLCGDSQRLQSHGASEPGGEAREDLSQRSHLLFVSGSGLYRASYQTRGKTSRERFSHLSQHCPAPRRGGVGGRRLGEASLRDKNLHASLFSLALLLSLSLVFVLPFFPSLTFGKATMSLSFRFSSLLTGAS